MQQRSIIILVLLGVVFAWAEGQEESAATEAVDPATLLGENVPSVTLMEEAERLYDLPLYQKEEEGPFTISAHAYLYWPSHQSYTPLEYVRVLVVPLDSAIAPYYIEDHTNREGEIEFQVKPYDPVSLVFDFDKEIKVDAAIDRDHLVPIVAFVAGRPSQRTDIHITLMTVRHILLHYGIDVFLRLYGNFARSLVGVPDVQARVISGVKDDLRALCYGENAEYVREKLGDDIEGICSWSIAVPESDEG